MLGLVPVWTVCDVAVPTPEGGTYHSSPVFAWNAISAPAPNAMIAGLVPGIVPSPVLAPVTPPLPFDGAVHSGPEGIETPPRSHRRTAPQ